MQETRQNRISRLLQKELAEIFQLQTRQMHGVLVSVTRVRISPDLSICTAYLSIFPSEKAEEILNNITRNEKSIRFELGQRVRNQLRIIPELRFFIDASLDYIDHIHELLKKYNCELSLFCRTTLSLFKEKDSRYQRYFVYFSCGSGSGYDGVGCCYVSIQRLSRPCSQPVYQL